MSIIKRSCTILALLAVVLSIVNAFSVTTTYTSSDCAAASQVSRTVSAYDCPTNNPGVVYDACTAGTIDGSFYIFNSTYCNLTTAPELLDGFYSMYSWYTDTNCTEDYSLRVEVVTQGQPVPITVLTDGLLQATVQVQCDASDSLFFNQCVPVYGCVNATIPHSACTNVGSWLYQTTCYEHRNGASAPQSMMPSAAGPTSTSQPNTAPQTKTPSAKASGSSTTAILSLAMTVIVSTYVALF